MPKSQYVDPGKVFQPGYIDFESIPLCTYSLTLDEEKKLFYYRGLKEWEGERGYLRDTCLAAQHQFKKYLDYFRIPYDNNL